MEDLRQQEFFDHIARALGREDIPTSVPDFNLANGPQNYMMQNMTQEEIVEKFKIECDKVGTAHVDATLENLPQVLKEVIKNNNGTTVLCPDMEEVETYGIRKMLEESADEGLVYQKWDASKGHEAMIEIAKDSSIGITFPIMGIANTATIIQPSDVKSGRAVGLLPLTHIAIIKKSTIMPRMTQTMAKLSELYHKDPAKFPRNIVHISGPSNTADIELIRVVGVHGPINVTFILLEA